MEYKKADEITNINDVNTTQNIIKKEYSDKKTNYLFKSGISFNDDNNFPFKEIRDCFEDFYKFCGHNCANINELNDYINSFIPDYMDYIKIKNNNYTQIINNENRENQFINAFKNMLTIFYHCKRIEYEDIIPKMQRAEANFNGLMNKSIFRLLVVEAYKTNDNVKRKGEYIRDNINNPDVNNILIADHTIDEWFGLYITAYGDYNRNNSKNQVQFNINQNPINPEEVSRRIEIPKELIATNYFNIKKNKRLYGLHHVAFPGTYQIDLMFSGMGYNCYLIAIEVNTRYLYATRTNIEVTSSDEYGNVKTETQKKTSLAIYLAMERLFDQGWRPSVIKSDSESAFLSDFIKNRVYAPRKIIHKPVFRIKKYNGVTAPLHTSLAIVDRVIRTIKTKLKNRGYVKGELPTSEVYKFVDHYNNKRHRTLSDIFNRDVTPKQVHDNINLEMFVIRDRMAENEKIKRIQDWQLPQGTVVKVYIDKDSREKRPRQTKLMKYRVVNNIDNIYTIQNMYDNTLEKTSRIKIARD